MIAIELQGTVHVPDNRCANRNIPKYCPGYTGDETEIETLHYPWRQDHRKKYIPPFFSFSLIATWQEKKLGISSDFQAWITQDNKTLQSI